MLEQQLYLDLHADRGLPVMFNVYSFVPGYSKEGDDDSLVPTGDRLSLAKGKNEIRLDLSTFQTPQWWLKENGNPDVRFMPEDIRWLEFCAEYDQDMDPVSDTLKIHAFAISN